MDADEIAQLNELADQVAGDGVVSPALGALWAHAVNTRLIMQLQATHRTVSLLRFICVPCLKSQAFARFQITIAKSPVAPVSGFSYLISSAGIEVDTAHAPFTCSNSYGGDVNISAVRTLGT